LGSSCRLSYLAFTLGLIFPCAQRCFNSRDSFLRAAALMLPRFLRRSCYRASSGALLP